MHLVAVLGGGSIAPIVDVMMPSPRQFAAAIFSGCSSSGVLTPAVTAATNSAARRYDADQLSGGRLATPPLAGLKDWQPTFRPRSWRCIGVARLSAWSAINVRWPCDGQAARRAERCILSCVCSSVVFLGRSCSLLF